METTLYYFSATGNCLSIAKQLNSKLEDSKLVSIPQMMQKNEEIRGDIIGIICPIYMHNLPRLVVDFIQKIAEANYLFLVFAGAGDLGHGDKKAQKLFSENHVNLSALFNVSMPSNYANYGAVSPERQGELLRDAEKKVEEIAQIVQARAERRDSRHSSFFQSNIHPGILYKLGYPRIPIMDKSFSTDENCNGCGICQKVCPAKNLSLEDRKPVWHNKCQFCYACLQWCPKESIQSGKKTVGVKRYHHPDVTVQDIMKASLRVD